MSERFDLCVGVHANLRLGNTATAALEAGPSSFVPTLMPPTVKTAMVHVSPEELIRESLPWDSMQMTVQDRVKWNVDRLGEFGSAGKGAEIPVSSPPVVSQVGAPPAAPPHSSNRQSNWMTLNDWGNVVEAPPMPDNVGPTVYSVHQKPAGYYRNPYTVPLVSFLDIASQTNTEAHAESGSSAAAATKYSLRDEPPFYYDMKPFLKMRAKLQQFAPEDQGPESQVSSVCGQLPCAAQL